MLAFLLYHTASLKAQSYIADVRKLSVENGLSNRFVKSIYKDSQGFMWIGTRYGLNRYDGYEFKLYTRENSPLSTNYIGQIHEDSQQQLWIVQPTDRKLFIDIIDPQTSRIQNFDTLFKTFTPLKSETILDVYADTEKTLWFITKAGKLYRYKNTRFEQVATLATFKQDKTKIFHVDKGFVWLLHGDKWQPLEVLTGIDIETSTVKTFDVHEILLLAGMDDFRTLWLFRPEEKTFVNIDWEKQVVVPATVLPPELPDFASSVTFAGKRHLNPPGDFIWLFSGSNNRRIGFPIAWNLRENIGYDFRDDIAPLLTYKNTLLIDDACLDAENRLWLATEDGILILSLKKSKFTTITAAAKKNYSARGIVEDQNGIIYISTYSGGLQLHPEKGILETENIGIGTAITKDREGRFWFSENRFATQYDPVTRKKQYYKYKVAPGQLMPKKWTMMSDTRGQIWIGSGRGLYILEQGTDHFREFTHYNTFTELKESIIYHMQETEEGIWIAAASGLYLLKPREGITKRYWYSSQEALPYSVPQEQILHFYRDTEGIFWLASKGGGLIRFNPEKETLRQFTTADGLSNNIIYAVYEDDYGKLWLPSNYGLMQFDKKNYRITTYLKDDGIAHNEFNTSSHYQASDGRLYFGGLAGITSFHPKDFTAELPQPTPLRITRCQVLNGKTGQLTDKTRTTINTGTLALSPSDKSLLIEFALLNYKNTQSNSYTYKIEGLDQDWTPIHTNTLRINALPYGSYTLHIKGRGIEGELSVNTLTIKLLVSKPFYLKNGFVLATIAMLALLIYGIFYWRLQRLRQSEIRLKSIVKKRTEEIQQQKDKLEELNTVQARWFTNITHELRTPLTLILGPARQLLKSRSGKTKEELKQLRLVEKNSEGLLRLVNQIMDISRLESGHIQLQKAPAPIDNLIEVSVANFESFAHQKGVNLTTRIEDNVVVHVDKERIQNILFNLISNALKFTHSGESVTVSLQHREEEDVAISVIDTGDGISEHDLPHIFERYYQASDPKQVNQGGTGVGLSLALELARLHGGNIVVQSQLGKGSVFTLLLPRNALVSVKPPKASGKPSASLNTIPKTQHLYINDQETKPHVLLVEDNLHMRKYIRSFMASDYELTEAVDGLEALKYLKKITPDLVISDIMMPRMDGITLAKTLKQEDRLKAIPFITLTAKIGESDKMEALRIGIDDYLTKPFNAEELQVRAANLIRNHKTRKNSSAIDPEEITQPDHREQRITAMRTTVMKQIQNNNFTTSDLANSQHMSLSTLRRFLNKTTGLSPALFIREIRLQHALKLLETGQYATLSEIVYAVGFKNSTYFNKLFTARFGKKPTEYF